MRKRHYLLAPLFGLLCAPAGAATTQAFAELDWTTLTVTLSDLTPSDGLLPSFEWTSMTSFVRLQGPYDLANSTSDWLTPLAISGGGASGSMPRRCAARTPAACPDWALPPAPGG